jgi:hypothetical protein
MSVTTRDAERLSRIASLCKESSVRRGIVKCAGTRRSISFIGRFAMT